MGWRPRLYHIKDEDELFEYFAENAGYLEQDELYHVAGIYSDDTARLFNKLKIEWKEDIRQHTKELLANKNTPT